MLTVWIIASSTHLFSARLSMVLNLMHNQGLFCPADLHLLEIYQKCYSQCLIQGQAKHGIQARFWLGLSIIMACIASTTISCTGSNLHKLCKQKHDETPVTPNSLARLFLCATDEPLSTIMPHYIRSAELCTVGSENTSRGSCHNSNDDEQESIHPQPHNINNPYDHLLLSNKSLLEREIGIDLYVTVLMNYTHNHSNNHTLHVSTAIGTL